MVHRELELYSRLDLGASVLLLGARSVGKTALAKLVLDSRSNSFALDLLNADTYSRYLKDPQQFTRDVAGRLEAVDTRLLVFVDEIQKVPSLMDGVHSLYESERGKVQFLLSGSSARKLKRGGANLLAGRLLNLRLHPLTSREWEMDFEQRLILGSLPGVVYGNPDPQATLRSYAHLYLKEEIQQEALVRRVDAFSRFLELAGQYHGMPINATAIGRDAGVSAHTISEYYQILEDTLLAFRLPGWSASARKQLRTAPRYYLFDNGVVSALRGELRLEVSPRTSRYGKLFESFVVQEAFRLNDYRELDLKFSYWQNRDGLEVDLIVSRGAGQPIAAIEIKSSTSPQDKDLSGLFSFLSDYPKTPSYVFCQTPHSYRTDLGIQVLPWKIGLETLPSL